MKIISHREPNDSEFGMSYEFYNGEYVSKVIGKLDNGTETTVWVSDRRPGYYKQVFVPCDFNHPDMIPSPLE